MPVVAELSTSRKAVIAAQVASRAASRAAGRSRLLRAAWQGTRAAALSVGRALLRIWLEITGVFFLLFAAVGGAAAWRQYRLYAGGHGDLLHLAAPGVFGLLFLWFGLTSFWRAHKKGSSRG